MGLWPVEAGLGFLDWVWSSQLMVTHACWHTVVLEYHISRWVALDRNSHRVEPAKEAGEGADGVLLLHLRLAEGSEGYHCTKSKTRRTQSSPFTLAPTQLPSFLLDLRL